MKRRALSPFSLTQILTMVVIGVGLWLAYWPWRWGQVRDEVRSRYPDVKQIDTEHLQQWLAGRTAPPVLLDVRSAAEFSASRLPGAHRVVPGALLADNQLDGKEHAQVVVYDTVGFDAASFASYLIRQHHFTDVQILEGGIYQWVNEGKPLVNDQGAATKVVPGAGEYASFLDRAHRAP